MTPNDDLDLTTYRFNTLLPRKLKFSHFATFQMVLMDFWIQTLASNLASFQNKIRVPLSVIKHISLYGNNKTTMFDWWSFIQVQSTSSQDYFIKHVTASTHDLMWLNFVELFLHRILNRSLRSSMARQQQRNQNRQKATEAYSPPQRLVL